jgi:hypothetical protein
VTHGLPLGSDALCDEGRSLLERAQRHIAVRMGEKAGLEPWESRVLVALVMAQQAQHARREPERAPPRSFAEEAAEAVQAMGDDMARTMPGLLRALPRGLLALLGLGGGAPRRPAALTAAPRVNLTATRGSERASYQNQDPDDADRVERDLTDQGWTVTRTRVQPVPQSPRRRR